MTIAKYKASGLTLDAIRNYYANITVNAKLVNPTYELTKIGEEQGHMILHNFAKAPWPVTNRSTIVCVYIKDREGTYTYMASSKACEHIIE